MKETLNMTGWLIYIYSWVLYYHYNVNRHRLVQKIKQQQIETFKGICSIAEADTGCVR